MLKLIILFLLLSNIYQGYGQSPNKFVIKNNGTCESITEYEMGKDGGRVDGVHILFFDSSYLNIYRIFTIKNRYVIGKVQTFNKKGILIELANYENGDEDGMFYYWNDNAELTKKELWSKGKLKNKWIFKK